MHPHHAETISRVKAHFSGQEDVLAVLLTGSIAHGFERENSDVDIAIIVRDVEFDRRKRTGEMTFYDTALCSYSGGYVDGKFVNIGFIQEVAKHGSEPARFAFKDAQAIVSKIENIESLIAEASKYPEHQRLENLLRFQAQFEAWYWYIQEAFKTKDSYLLQFTASKLVLFGCRQILAHNRMLFPYHKWLTRVVSQAPDQPHRFSDLFNALLQDPTLESATQFFKAINEFVPRVPSDQHWSTHFMIDSELNWMSGRTPVDDL
jgi:predicted nucleotidyltransferase